MKSLFIFAIAVFVLTGCQSAVSRTTDSGVPNVAGNIQDVSPIEAQVAVSKAYSQFIDVRTAEEYAGGHAGRSENIPLDILAANLARLSKSEPVYIICQTGNRSNKAAAILKEAGFTNVTNVTGGTVAWQAAGLPMETRAPHNIPPPK